ncbi:DMT family transporter [Actinoallomurus purpureus]|uniref:EamA family transporter n=1 Tax=Actinoallomurus purpureus TaxID=478114 RepID=UPI00209224A5|nr:DMT family transporter [Actinoallomurus purpureus]MCO6008856.1 DMT family transporter [Actinoallomurus purpureus]
MSHTFPLVPALAVIFAGVLHATWNALAKAATDRYAGFALIGAAQGGAGLLMLCLAAAPARASWPWIAVSIALHAVYTWLLARSYELGDFNQVYPLARGTGPLIVAFVAATALGEHLSTTQLAGVAAICGGLGALAFAGGVSRRQGRAIGAAVLTGVSIAGYTLVDGVGVRHAGTAVGYSGWLFFGMGPVVVAWVAVARGRSVWPAARAQWRSGLPGGLISVLGYGIVVWAQTRGALAAVAALRETGVITGAIIGVVFFHERMGLPRLAAAGVVVTGVALINLH